MNFILWVSLASVVSFVSGAGCLWVWIKKGKIKAPEVS